MRLIKLIPVVIASCYLLTACGQMGPLYLPPAEPAKPPINKVKTTQNDTTTQSTQDKPNAN